MANPEHLAILKEGVEVWNEWREQNPEISPDLEGASLGRLTLRRINLSGANLNHAFLTDSPMTGANLNSATLVGTVLWRVDFSPWFWHKSDLSNTNFYTATLMGCNFTEAIFHHSRLELTDLSESTLLRTDFSGATIEKCRVYGTSSWGLMLENTVQKDLIISPVEESNITVDDLTIAQFIYLLRDNKNVWDIIDTITSKLVLILGRFSDERKHLLDSLRDNLRTMNLTPVVFDFDKPASKDVTGTVETLARMAKFIIADLTDPSSIPHELATVIPFLRTTPVLPLKLGGTAGYSMFTFDYMMLDFLLSQIIKD